MTTPPVKSTTDELIEEIEAAASKATPGEWTAKGTLFGEWSIGSDYTTDGKRLDNGRQLVAFSPAASKTNAPVYAAMFEANAKHIALCSPANVQTLIARIRELEEAQRWVPVEERLPEPGLLVQVYSPPQPGDWPDTVRIDTDGIDPESEDYWVGHGEHYERYCMIAKGGDVEWTGPAEKAPYTHWKPMPEPPQ